jgi:uncharacterized protein (UPF0276 family)
MIQLGITCFPLVLDMLPRGLDVDYVKVDADSGLEMIRRAKAYKPVLLHDIPEPFWLNYTDPFQEETMEMGRQLLEAAKSPWFSTGIGASAEPQMHRHGPFREADDENLQPRQEVLTNIVQHGQQLKEWLGGLPLLLENYNYHPTNAYEYVCEPEFVHYVLDEVGCEMLLDLAHAQISAHNMDWPNIQTYLEALPLDKVREIHINHPIRNGKNMLDGHQPLQRKDIVLLRWTLERTPNAKVVTLETDDMDETVLHAQLAMLRQALAG